MPHQLCGIGVVGMVDVSGDLRRRHPGPDPNCYRKPVEWWHGLSCADAVASVWHDGELGCLLYPINLTLGMPSQLRDDGLEQLEHVQHHLQRGHHDPDPQCHPIGSQWRRGLPCAVQ